MADILYADGAGFCFVVVVFLLYKISRDTYVGGLSRPYKTLLRYFAVFTAVDAIWGVFASHTLIIGTIGYELATYGFHTMASVAAFAWLGFALKYLYGEKKIPVQLVVIRYAILVVQLAILWSNEINHRFFEITEDVIYVTGPNRRILFWIQFGTYIFVALISIVMLMRVKSSHDKRFASNQAIFSMVPLATGILQLLLPDAPCYSYGFMLVSIFIYAIVIAQERETALAEIRSTEERKHSNAIMLALTNEYFSVCHVNMVTGEMSVFRTDDEFVECFGNQINENMTFSEAFSNYVEHFVTDAYKEEMIKFADMDFLRDSLRKEPVIYREYMLRHDEKEEYFEMKCALVDYDDGTCREAVIGFANCDDEVRKQMQKEEELRVAKASADEANAAKSRFLFNMSHDIRTPMNAILGFTNMAGKNIDNKTKLEECLGKVSTAGEHLLSLINDVLDMARIESRKTEIIEAPVNIYRAVDSISPVIEEMAREKDIDFANEFVNIKDENIYADMLHVNQIFMNLISNAVKYTQPGGRVRFIVEQKESGEADAAQYMFTIADNGVGMSEEFVKHIFEEFAREKSATQSGIEGTGLGMSIVKNLTELMNGDLEIDSEQGRGTTVTVALKFRKILSETDIKIAMKDDRQDATEKEKMLASVSGKRILLVEDNELNREIARDILEELGLVIEDADDGTVAVDMVSERPADYYDAVIMDVQMPVMDGYEATGIIRSRGGAYAEIPIIAMTANAFEEDKRNALNAGMNGHIAKPVNPEVILSTLAELIG